MKIAITLIRTSNICLTPQEKPLTNGSVNQNRAVVSAFLMFCISLLYEHTTVHCLSSI